MWKSKSKGDVEKRIGFKLNILNVMVELWDVERKDMIQELRNWTWAFNKYF